MKIKRINIKNFRLLRDVSLSLEDITTVIVGRNNSGKTSLTELFRRLLSDSPPKFLLEDFSLLSHEAFWNAFLLHIKGEEENKIREALPEIEARIYFSYGKDEELGPLSEFIIDLDVSVLQAIADIKYSLKSGKIKSLFDGCTYEDNENIEKQKVNFYKLIQDRIPNLYEVTLLAVDPTDETNQKKMAISALKRLLLTGFINAQRGLDDVTHKEKDVLGKILTKLLANANTETANANDQDISNKLNEIMADIKEKIDNDYNKQVIKLMPTLEVFGYPGLNDPKIFTETQLDTQSLLESHTRIRYTGANGIGLPETYNGLGSRNLMYILFQMYEFFKSYQVRSELPGVQLVFIEEPEAHLHPQMQEVFIRQISSIAKIFEKEFNGGKTWPVQFVITTHSTHMANEAPFEAVRYFLGARNGTQYTIIKDLGEGFCDEEVTADKEFLHKYLTLTRCDLFFADKAILIEGPTERILMPKMIEKVDADNKMVKLASQYISLIEVGGAYAHHFYKLLDFLEIPSLIITDIDSVKEVKTQTRKNKCACKTSEGTHTSNAGIKKWFEELATKSKGIITLKDIESMKIKDKVKRSRRIAYQIPEEGLIVYGRSFEDAFMLANCKLFDIEGLDDFEKETEAYEMAQNIEKTNFALEYAIDKTIWNVPKYIREGLIWLAERNTTILDSEGLTLADSEAAAGVVVES